MRWLLWYMLAGVLQVLDMHALMWYVQVSRMFLAGLDMCWLVWYALAFAVSYRCLHSLACCGICAVLHGVLDMPCEVC